MGRSALVRSHAISLYVIYRHVKAVACVFLELGEEATQGHLDNKLPILEAFQGQEVPRQPMAPPPSGRKGAPRQEPARARPPPRNTEARRPPSGYNLGRDRGRRRQALVNAVREAPRARGRGPGHGPVERGSTAFVRPKPGRPPDQDFQGHRHRGRHRTPLTFAGFSHPSTTGVHASENPGGPGAEPPVGVRMTVRSCGWCKGVRRSRRGQRRAEITLKTREKALQFQNVRNRFSS